MAGNKNSGRLPFAPSEDDRNKVRVLRASGMSQEAISVDYRAGWPIVDNKPTVPADIRTAIIARVQIGYEQTATDAGKTIASMESALISKWRRPIL